MNCDYRLSMIQRYLQSISTCTCLLKYLFFLFYAVRTQICTANNVDRILLKVIEKCTNFYFGTEKLPPKF